MDPLTLSAVLSGGGLLASFFGKKKEPTVQKVNTLNPAQEAAQSYVTKLLGSGGTPYTGTRVAGLSGAEESQLGNVASLADASRAGLLKVLSGEFPEADFQAAVQNPMLRALREDVIPYVQERFAGPRTGNFYSSAMTGSVQKAINNTLDTIAAERGKLALGLLEAPIKASVAASESSRGYLSALGLPREIDQKRLDTEYEEFLRTNPEAGGYLSAALQFLGIPTQGFVNVPGSTNRVSEALFGAGNVLSNYGLQSQLLNLLGQPVTSSPGNGG